MKVYVVLYCDSKKNIIYRNVKAVNHQKAYWIIKKSLHGGYYFPKEETE